MNDKDKNERVRSENCRMEYGSVTEGWKFFATLRFVVAAFAVTLQSGLFALYIQVMKNGLGKERVGAVIAIVGAYVILAISLIERRTVIFLIETMCRGSELEFSLGVLNGFFSRISAPGLFRPRGLRKITTHTSGLILVYVSIFILWIYLFFVNLFK